MAKITGIEVDGTLYDIEGENEVFECNHCDLRKKCHAKSDNIIENICARIVPYGSYFRKRSKNKITKKL